MTVGSAEHRACDLACPSAKRSSFFDGLELNEKEQAIAHLILKEINSRLGFLVNVGLDYLTLSRAAGTLSGGEAQRIRLATQIGSSLMGVLYILDEPSIGLHQRDNDRLIQTLVHMRDLGNTLIVVEHDEDTMLAADYIIDIGPGAGIHGGQVVAQGTPQEIMANENSLTGALLERTQVHPGAAEAAQAERQVAGGPRRQGKQSARTSTPSSRSASSRRSPAFPAPAKSTLGQRDSVQDAGARSEQSEDASGRVQGNPRAWSISRK